MPTQQAPSVLIAALEELVGEAQRHMVPEVRELIPTCWQSFLSMAFVERGYS
jgi:hypothetical protein